MEDKEKGCANRNKSNQGEEKVRLISISRKEEKIHLSVELSSMIEFQNLKDAMGFAREAFEKELSSKFRTECVNKYSRLETFFGHILGLLI